MIKEILFSLKFYLYYVWEKRAITGFSVLHRKGVRPRAKYAVFY